MKGIRMRGISKIYRSGRMEYQALRDIDLDISEGELTAIVGPSGCGKTTLLNMMTGIDRPNAGTVHVDGIRIDHLRENRLARWRGANVGVVFQFFQLFPTLTALENAMFPMDLSAKWKPKERKERASGNLELVGLGSKLQNLPSELSGGEQQRVAIARAMANDPGIIIGDEPTGNLDSRTEAAIFRLFKELNSGGKTILYVTHSRELAKLADRRIEMLDGRIVS
ncbi:MAG: ABC transporter ATP-binding protein [Thermoplasmatota archaeon]